MPFLFQPTSVQRIASRGSTARRSARMRSGRIGQASLSIAFLLPATNVLRLAAISATSFARLHALRRELARDAVQHRAAPP